jgi:hypothetical protein
VAGSTEALSKEAIEQAIHDVRERRAAAEAGRANSEREMASCREEERLLQRLLALRTGSGAPDNASEDESSTLISVGEDGPATARQTASETVVEELAVSGRPIHISELLRTLQTRNVALPGAGTQANLISILVRDDRVIRTSRGMYGLASWGLSHVQPTTRTRTRRKRVRRSGHAIES